MPFAVRPRFDLRLRTRSLPLGQRTMVMGILNVTPDSFSDGGQFFTPRAAVDHALNMLDQGADLLDIGAESTRPNATALNPAEEQSRLLPVLHAILVARPNAILSVDTYRSETARLAIEAGAEIVNDVSGHLWDSAMSATCADLGCGAILMHTRGRPSEWRSSPAIKPADVLPLVLSDLVARADAALSSRIARESIILDPGFGFGKAFDENYPLLAGFDQLQSLGFPLLAGVSRKSFLARTLKRSHSAGLASASEASTAHPGLPTQAANTAAILAGAHILRVHDVAPARETAAIADRILQASTR
jgi:dihydropteroate synthase